MKIAVLGATGRTGKYILEEGIKRGHKLIVIARNPEKLNDFDVELIEGTPYDPKTVEKAVKGCDAIINTLNVSRKSDNPWAPLTAPEDLISRSASNAIQAMEKEGVKRFVALSTIGAGRSWKSAPFVLRFIVRASNLRYAFTDHGKQEELLENSSLDYTICRAPMLSMKTNKTGVAVTKEGEKQVSAVLSRNSAAAFFLDIIEKKEYLREVISIANKPA